MREGIIEHATEEAQVLTLSIVFNSAVETWDEFSFSLVDYQKVPGMVILSSCDEIMTENDDQLVKTQTMKGSPSSSTPSTM